MISAASLAPARLVTIGPSHYCEKARWALERLGVPYREERHPPVLHILHARYLGGGQTVPVVVTGSETLTDSSDILRHFDARADPERRLYPADPELRREVEALEDEFDDQLGPATRRLAYYHLLDDSSSVAPLTQGARRRERWLFRLALPLARGLMRRAMRIDAAGAERSRAKLDAICEQITARLEGGKRYLVGEQFSAADLTFAALMAPLVWPPEYGFPMPDLRDGPQSFRDEVNRIRATRAGGFALRLYGEERS